MVVVEEMIARVWEREEGESAACCVVCVVAVCVREAPQYNGI
jgi:hypothetical protein